ncbi:MAG: undecaprenyl phosphate translocase family protein, partial [Vreelandella alkaliphila]|uniref:undecaprenyl phosphate translocase family protein n=2 Tax=Halomonadaceae TaxID=28256 RepID=UPI003F94B2C8
GMGCVVGLALFSRLLSWLLRRHHDSTLQLLLGFIVGSLPVLWPWKELVSYQLGPDGQMIPLAHRYLLPSDYAVLSGASAQTVGVVALMVVGALLVVLLNRRAVHYAGHRSIGNARDVEKE